MIPRSSRHRPFPETSSQGTVIVDGEGQARVSPTPERLKQAKRAGRDAVREVVTEVEVRQGVVERATTKRLADRDVLALLLSREAIGLEQFSVGEDFYRHWEGSGLASGGVVDLVRPRVDGGSHKPESDQQLWHLGKWTDMVARLGDIHTAVLCDCVLFGESLEDYGLRVGPYRNAKQARDWAQCRLTGALDQLVINELGKRQVRGRAAMAEGARPVPPADAPARREVEVRGRPGAPAGARDKSDGSDPN
jgi:hypothetical protein